MAQSLSAVYVHLVFSTKDRYPFLERAEVREATHAYLGGISKQLGCPPIAIGGVEDHVHLLAQLGRSIALAEWVKELKRSSTLWIKSRGLVQGDFQWQGGYGVFSVSASKVEQVKAYVLRQEDHHRKVSFQDELQSLLRKHGVEPRNPG